MSAIHLYSRQKNKKMKRHSLNEKWFYTEIDKAMKTISNAIETQRKFPQRDKMILSEMVAELSLIEMSLYQMLYQEDEVYDEYSLFGDWEEYEI